MKKKIGDLTLREAHEICKNNTLCDKCVLLNVPDDECMFEKVSYGCYIDEEIEVQE